MIGFLRIVLLLILLHSVSLRGDSASSPICLYDENENSDFLTAKKTFKLEPLAHGDSTTSVRIISKDGWSSSVLTVLMPLAQKPAVAELKVSWFDDQKNEDVVKSVSSVLTAAEFTLLQNAINLPRSFDTPPANRSRPAIDVGWYFVELQTPTAYKWLFHSGSADQNLERKKLTVALRQIITRIAAETKGTDSVHR